MSDEMQREQQSRWFSELLKGPYRERSHVSLTGGEEPHEPRHKPRAWRSTSPHEDGKPKRKRSTNGPDDEQTSWNHERLPVWHPLLQGRLFWWILTAPDQIVRLYRSEYVRKEIGGTGTWLALTLILLPLALGLLALSLNPRAVDLFARESMTALAFLCTAMGMAATVAAVSDRPFMGFLAFISAFFGGLILGLASALIVERFTTAAYALGRPSVRGYVCLGALLLGQTVGFWMLLTAR